MRGIVLTLKKTVFYLVSATTALTGAVDLSKFSANEMYMLGDVAHEEGDFELSAYLMRNVAPRGRSQALIDLHALRTMQWDNAHTFYSPDYWWYNGDITGQKIFIKHDGGVGDAVQFLRYAKQLHDAGAQVIIETPPALSAIYARCPFIDKQIPYGSAPADANVTITLSTPRLTYAVRNNLEERITDVPYISADPHLVAHWHKKLSGIPGKKIGLCWCSSPLYNSVTKEKSVSPRSIPLTLFEPMLAYEPCTFISLQCGFGAEQLRELINHRPLVFEGIDTIHGRFMDTIAIMENLDLVISVDTSIAHIAGALGVPIWLILPKCSDFRWFTDRTDSVWYPTMRIFRQKPYEEWEPVLNKVFAALKEFCTIVAHDPGR
jgi:hypothetical protein